MRLRHVAVSFLLLSLFMLRSGYGSAPPRGSDFPLRLSVDGAPLVTADGGVLIQLVLHNDGDKAVDIHFSEQPWVKMAPEHLLIFKDGKRMGVDDVHISRPYGHPFAVMDVIEAGASRAGVAFLSQMDAGQYELTGLIPCAVICEGKARRAFLALPHVSFSRALKEK